MSRPDKSTIAAAGSRGGALVERDDPDSSVALQMARRSLRRQVKVVMFALGLPLGLLLSTAVIALLSSLTVVTPPMALVWTVSISMAVGLSLTLRPLAGVFTSPQLRALEAKVATEPRALARAGDDSPREAKTESPDSV